VILASFVMILTCDYPPSAGCLPGVANPGLLSV